MQSQYMFDAQSPTDPDRFLAMTQVYQRAARIPKSCVGLTGGLAHAQCFEAARDAEESEKQ